MVDFVLDLPALERKEGIRKNKKKKNFGSEVDKAVSSIYG